MTWTLSAIAGVAFCATQAVDARTRHPASKTTAQAVVIKPDAKIPGIF